MKRFFALLMSLVLLVVAIPAVYATDYGVGETPEFVDYIIETHGVRGVNTPTRSWNLTVSNYNGSFSGVEAGVYTNYYFKGISYIVVSFDDLRTDAEDCVFQFRLIDLTDSAGTSAAKSVRLKGGDDGEYVVETYANLNTSHKYCIFMRTVNPGEAASGRISVSGS